MRARELIEKAHEQAQHYDEDDGPWETDLAYTKAGKELVRRAIGVEDWLTPERIVEACKLLAGWGEPITVRPHALRRALLDARPETGP